MPQRRAEEFFGRGTGCDHRGTIDKPEALIVLPGLATTFWIDFRTTRRHPEVMASDEMPRLVEGRGDVSSAASLLWWRLLIRQCDSLVVFGPPPPQIYSLLRSVLELPHHIFDMRGGEADE